MKLRGVQGGRFGFASRSTLVVLFGALALASSACQKQGAPPDRARTVVTPETENSYTRASCQFRFDEGGEARADLIGVSERRVILFGKTVDLAPLRAVLRASASATVAWIGRFRAQVYGMPGQLALACPFYANLPAPPEDFRAYWAEVTAKDTRERFVAGLYAGVRHPKVPTSTGGGDAMIGVRRDASRWTLLHEFGHHLFRMHTTERGGISDEQLTANLVRGIERFDVAQKEFERSPTLDSRREKARRFIEFAPLMQSLLTRFQLEEVSLEALLRQAYSAGRTSYVADELQSSRSYLTQSAWNAYKLLERVQLEAAEERADLLLSAPSLVDEVAGLTALESSTAALMDEIGTVINSLPGTTPALPAGGLSSLLTLSPRPAPRAKPTCAHGEAVDAAIQFAGAALGQGH